MASVETRAGCEAVNVRRRENGLAQLGVVLVDVIGREGELVGGDGHVFGDKISSTWLRDWLARHDGLEFPPVE